MKRSEIDWKKAREIVKKRKKEWFEDIDEAEGDFLGWKKNKSHNVVTFKEFCDWWEINKDKENCVIKKCDKCEKEEEVEVEWDYLPYRWSEVHRKTADVDDSACIFYESDLLLCDQCTLDLIKPIKKKKRLLDKKGN